MPSLRRAAFASAIAAVTLLAAACSSTAPSEVPPGTEVTPAPAAIRVGTPIPLDPNAPLTAVQVRSWSDRLFSLDSEQLDDFFQVARSTRDERFTIPLIEAMRFYEPTARLFFTDTLRLITGVDLPGDDTWPQWYQWLAAHPEVPHILGYETWKADLYRSAAGGSPFQRFLIDGRDSALRVELIQFSGAAIEGFPTLNRPSMIAGATADYLTLEESVIGIEIGGDARAYPLRLLDWHETINDTVGGTPLTIAYCTFCGSGAVWDRRLDDQSEPLTFGYSGLIYEATRLMHDNESDNLWSPITGEPVHGPRVGSAGLTQLPSVQTTWADWLARHPATTVLDLDTGYVREYTFDTRPAAYRASDTVNLPYAQSSDLLPPKTLVFSPAVGSTRVAYRLDDIRADGAVNDTIEGQRIVLVADSPTGGIRAFEAGDHTFEATSAGLTDSGGMIWKLTERGLQGPAGALLPRIPGTQAYWFAQFIAFPDTTLR